MKRGQPRRLSYGKRLQAEIWQRKKRQRLAQTKAYLNVILAKHLEWKLASLQNQWGTCNSNSKCNGSNAATTSTSSQLATPFGLLICQTIGR